jgi:hypothetical protein
MTRVLCLAALAGGILATLAGPVAADMSPPGTPLPRLPALHWEQRSDWISVKAQGAVGDGVADDTAAIQSAFCRIKRGVTIYFPPGTYRVTKTLTVDSPDEKSALYGVAVIGCGRDSRLVWDGPVGGTLIQEEGMGYSRWVGLDLDGAGKAALGQYHFSDHTFETVHRKLYMGYHNFTRAGVLHEPVKERFAMAETSFENCLFEKCGMGVSCTQFNDYDESFDGCEFRGCGIGIECIHGNYYARDCHFEDSTTVDIDSQPEHGCTIRRCTSLHSQKFLQHLNGVATMVVEGCAVAGWKDPAGALTFSSAPALVFDCAFSDPPAGAKCAIHVRSPGQKLLWSQNKVPATLPLFNAETQKWTGVRLYEIPAGQRPGVALKATQQFLTDQVAIPGKVFDAKRDFGAKGDNKTDDSAAIQATIDAARKAGKGAIAYLPSGWYIVKQTLKLTGGGYYIGGAGMISTMLTWQGAPDANTIEVTDPDHLIIEHLDLQKRSGVDILQMGTGKPSSVTYDGLFLSRPNDEPYGGGLCCRGLGAAATVRIPCVAGLMRFTDCARATILVPLSYYGALIVEGQEKARGGLTGILSRFSGGPHNVLVRDNQSLVMSDYYSESSGNIFLCTGGPDDPPGRITVQGAKLNLLDKIAGNTVEVNGYSGQIVIGPDQFNGPPAGAVKLAGDRPLDLVLAGCSFYHALLKSQVTGAAHFYQLGDLAIAVQDLTTPGAPDLYADSLPPEKLPLLSAALDDLRRLGEADLRVDHAGVLAH